MQTRRSGGEPLTPYNPKLNRTLRRMENQRALFNPNKGNLGDGVGQQPLLPVEVPSENQLGEALRKQPPAAP